MEGALILILYVFIIACIVGGIVYVVRSLGVPQMGQWAVAALLIVVLLFCLIHLVNGGSPHLPRW